MDGQRRRYSSMLAARARRRRLVRRLSIVAPVAALFFYLAVKTSPTPSTPSATQTYARLIAPQYSYVDPDAPDFVQYGLEECQNAGHRKDRLKCPLDRDRFDETRSMVVDLGVLAKADAFVGSLWSNVGRLSYELSAADKGCLPPLISRDVGWCSVDGQLQDGTVYGHLNC